MRLNGFPTKADRAHLPGLELGAEAQRMLACHKLNLDVSCPMEVWQKRISKDEHASTLDRSVPLSRFMCIGGWRRESNWEMVSSHACVRMHGPGVN